MSDASTASRGRQRKHNDVSIIRALRVKAIGLNLYTCESSRLWKPKRSRGIYGGQLVGQALNAASQSVNDPEFLLHSTHCYFLSPVQSQTIVYEVDKARDGRMFSSRSVKAIQDGKTVFLCQVSFRKPSSEETEGTEVCYYSASSCIPDVPRPGDLAKRGDQFELHELRHPMMDAIGFEGYVCIAKERLQSHEKHQPVEPKVMFWIRAKGSYGSVDHENLHRVVLACASDFNMAMTITLKYPTVNFTLITSLDHSIWYHNPVQSSLWHLFVAECNHAVGGTSLNMCRVFSENGTLIATCKQESLCRSKI